MPFEVSLNCVKGRAKIRCIPHPYTERVEILTGRRYVWDRLSWSGYGDGASVQVCGLFRGSYADAVVSVVELIQALESIGAKQAASEVKRASEAWARSMERVEA